MSRIYDNWERLVAAVLKKEQLWQLFHAQSRSPSISSESSGFSFSSGITSSVDDVSFSFSTADWSALDLDVKIVAATSLSILVKDQIPVKPNKDVTLTTPSRKRDLRIQVPKPHVQHYGAFSPKNTSPVHFSRVHPRSVGGNLESYTNWPDDAKQQSHPLPLPPDAFSSSFPFSRPNSTSTSPKVPLHSPEIAESRKSPCTSWKRGKLLARGAFGNVYLGFNSEKGKMCAMKEFKLSSDSANSKQRSNLFGKEIALLSSLKHPNIVPYFGSETLGDNLYIYYEYVSGGSIYMILQEYGKLGESAIRSYTQQILSGLAYLHAKSITHRDIRGHTILVDPTGGVKLSNFGIEKQIAGQSRPSVLMDSPYWMAPEVIRNPNVRNQAIDIWSLGCTVIEMATSKPPFSQYDGGVAVLKIANDRQLPPIPDHLSDEGKDFLRHCLQWNPVHRATASQLLDHPFVKSSSPLAKNIVVSKSSGYPQVGIAASSEGIDHTRSHRQLGSGKFARNPSRTSKSNFKPRSSNFLLSPSPHLHLQLSDIYTPRNISTPVSPVGSPLPHPRSPRHFNTHISPPIKSHPHLMPLISGNDTIQYHHHNRIQQETFRNSPKHSPIINSPSYWDPNILRGANDSHLKQCGKSNNSQINTHPSLADRVSQQLIRAPMTSHRVA